MNPWVQVGVQCAAALTGSGVVGWMTTRRNDPPEQSWCVEWEIPGATVGDAPLHIRARRMADAWNLAHATLTVVHGHHVRVTSVKPSAQLAGRPAPPSDLDVGPW